MGQYQLLAALLVIGPVLLIMMLRTNAAMVFLSMCAGYVVGTLLQADIRDFADMFLPGAAPSAAYIQIGLLVLPSLLTAVFFTHSVKGLGRILNLLPVLAVGSAMALLIVPLLPAGIVASIESWSLWHQFVRAQALCIGGGAVVSLLFLWLLRSPSRGASEPKKRTSD
jgi:hypothetical protein